MRRHPSGKINVHERKIMQKRSLMDIEVEVENLGSHLNAYTSREMTSYYARCMGSNITKSVDILADILLNSTLDSNAIARERDVILREAKEVSFSARTAA